MNTKLNDLYLSTTSTPLLSGGVARLVNQFGPRIVFDTPNEGNVGGEDDVNPDPDPKAEDNDGDKPDDDVDPEEDDADDEKAKADKSLLKEVMKKADRIKELQKQLDLYKGVDPKEFKKLQEEKQKALKAEREAQVKAAEAAGNLVALKEAMAAEHSEVVEGLTKQLEEMNAAFALANSQIQELTIGNAFSSSKFISEETVLTPAKARRLYGDHFDIEDGEIVAYDKPKGSANRIKMIDGKGNAISFADALQKIITKDPDFERLSVSKLKPGGSSKTQGSEVKIASTGPKGVGRIQSGLGNLKS